MKRRKPVRRNLWLALAFVLGCGVGYAVFHFTQHECFNLLIASGDTGETIT